MIRNCHRCNSLHDVEAAEDDRYWLCARCWVDGWRVTIFGHVYQVRYKRQ